MHELRRLLLDPLLDQRDQLLFVEPGESRPTGFFQEVAHHYLLGFQHEGLGVVGKEEEIVLLEN